MALIARNTSALKTISACAKTVEIDTNLRRLIESVVEAIRVQKKDATEMIKALLGLLTARRRMQLSGEDFVRILNDCIGREAPQQWREQHFSDWRNAQAELAALFSDKNPLAVFEKAVGLSLEHQNVLEHVRIITDVRPVFDDAGDLILHTLVDHVLMLEYYDGEESKRIHMALYARDIQELKKACERAEKKAERVVGFMKEASLPISHVGSSQDEC